MFIQLKNLLGRTVEAQDGEIGAISGFYYDDYQWALRYFVVKTDPGLNRVQALIAPDAFLNPDWKTGPLRTELTRGQVALSPAIEFGSILSIEVEERIADYYRWPAYWSTIATKDDTANEVTKPGPSAPELGYLQDPRHKLRDLRALTGFEVGALGEPLGTMRDFLVEDHDWQVEYIVVDPGRRLGGKLVLVTPNWINGTDWEDRYMDFNMSRSTIDSSPAFDPSAEFGQEQMDRFYKHYGVENLGQNRLEILGQGGMRRRNYNDRRE